MKNIQGIYGFIQRILHKLPHGLFTQVTVIIDAALDKIIVVKIIKIIYNICVKICTSKESVLW